MSRYHALPFALLLVGAPAAHAQDFFTATVNHVRGGVIAIVNPVVDLGRNVARESVGVINHVNKEVRNLPDGVVKAVDTTGNTAERLAHGAGGIVDGFQSRLSEGKVLDAPWHVLTDSLKTTEQVGLRAMQESSGLRFLGGAASGLAGPLGVAAFTGWFVGSSTNDVGKGLDAGAIAGASSWSLGKLQAARGNSVSIGLKKATASAAIGGAAAAANGGRASDGALSAAAYSAANSTYKAYTRNGATPDMGPGGDPVGKAIGPNDPCLRNGTCVYHVDPRHHSIAATATGIYDPNPSKRAGFWSGKESSLPMRAANIFPGVQPGSIIHEIGATGMCRSLNLATIVPAFVFTDIAAGYGYQSEELRMAVDSAKR